MKSSEVLPWVALVAFFFVMQLEIRLEVHSLRLKLTELSSYTHNQDQSQSTQASAYWAAAHRQELLLDDSKNAEEASARPTSGTGTLSEKETMEEGTGSRAKDPPFEVSVGSAPLQVDAAYSATSQQCVAMARKTKVLASNRPNATPGRRRVIFIRICGERIPNNQHQLYAIRGMIKHLGSWFSPAAEVYALSNAWDWRCPPAALTSVVGDHMKDVSSANAQTIMAFCPQSARAEVAQMLKTTNWPVKTIQEDLPSISGHTWHHVWYHPQHAFPPLTCEIDGTTRVRPFFLGVGGEVFWEHLIGARDSWSNEHGDALLYRTSGRQYLYPDKDDKLGPQRIPLIPYFNGVMHVVTDAELNVSDIERQVPMETAKKKSVQKDKFAAFMSSSKWCRPELNILPGPDAWIRALFVTKLRDYKHVVGFGKCLHSEDGVCKGLSIMGGAQQCIQDFKFSVTMDNQFEHGYLTEKVFNGLFAQTVPIYFGAPNISQLINPERFIFCDVSWERIRAMREEHQRVRQKWKYPMSMNATLDFTDKFVGKDIAACVQKVAEIDQDSERYVRMLRAPAILRQKGLEKTEFDGYNVSEGVFSLLQTMGSILLRE